MSGLRILLCAAAISATETKGKSPRSTDHAPPFPDPQLVKVRIARDVDWYRANLVRAHETNRSPNAQCNVDAAAALQAVSALWSHDPQRPGNEQERAWRALSKAVHASCDDALVLFVHARMYRATAQESTEETVRLHRQAASAMDVSKYAPVLKAMAHLRAAEAIIDDAIARLASTIARQASTARGAREQIEAAKDVLPSVAASREVPHPLMLDLVGGILDADRKLGGDRSEDVDSILPIFTKARSEKDPLLPLLRAHYLVDYAWDTRSGRAAEHVTENMQTVFLSRIEQADREVAKAIALDPLSPSIAPLMLTIELAEGKGRERMESWFAYGIAVDPGNNEIYSAKLHHAGMDRPRRRSPLGARRRGSGGHCGSRSLSSPHIFICHSSTRNPRTIFERTQPPAPRSVVSTIRICRRSRSRPTRSGYALLLYKCGDFAGAHKQFQILGGNGRIGP